MHDDQHGTAIVVLAGLINAMKVVDKRLQDCKIVLIGAGAAGTAIAKLLSLYQHPEIIAVDSKGVITSDRDDLTPEKEYLASLNYLAEGRSYSLQDALTGADVVIGVSRAGMFTAEDVKLMRDRAVIFALANPEPEIMPDIAKAAGAAVVATGRSDFPNQINNSIFFPGFWAGMLKRKSKDYSLELLVKAAKKIADHTKKVSAENILPSTLDKKIHKVVENFFKNN
jgi:malate dehydrogenase (oxaloacetate-decarboxylating)